jgi:hypothetical protein
MQAHVPRVCRPACCPVVRPRAAPLSWLRVERSPVVLWLRAAPLSWLRVARSPVVLWPRVVQASCCAFARAACSDTQASPVAPRCPNIGEYPGIGEESVHYSAYFPPQCSNLPQSIYRYRTCEPVMVDEVCGTGVRRDRNRSPAFEASIPARRPARPRHPARPFPGEGRAPSGAAPAAEPPRRAVPAGGPSRPARCRPARCRPARCRPASAHQPVPTSRCPPAGAGQPSGPPRHREKRPAGTGASDLGFRGILTGLSACRS